MAALPRSRAPRAALPPLLFVLALVLSACAGASSPAPVVTPTPTGTALASSVPTLATPAPSVAFPLTITDDEGTAVAIPTSPQRIVSLTPAATETLFAIGAGDRVVAKVEDIAAYPPAADALPVVATYQGVDIEKIVALKADLVIAGGLGFTPPDAVTKLRTLGIPVVVLYAESIEGALAGIEKVGLATGEAAAAAELTATMTAEIDRIGALTKGVAKPVTFYEIDATSAIYTVPADSLYAEMLRLAGADPITTDASYQISLEKLVAANPAVILLGDAASTKPADVGARPGWSGIQAVRDGKVFPVDDTLITRPGPRLVDGLRVLIAVLHPEVKL
jgi:iron complex transport system substrate-binding protein